MPKLPLASPTGATIEGMLNQAFGGAQFLLEGRMDSDNLIYISTASGSATFAPTQIPDWPSDINPIQSMKLIAEPGDIQIRSGAGLSFKEEIWDELITMMENNYVYTVLRGKETFILNKDNYQGIIERPRTSREEELQREIQALKDQRAALATGATLGINKARYMTLTQQIVALEKRLQKQETKRMGRSGGAHNRTIVIPKNPDQIPLRDSENRVIFTVEDYYLNKDVTSASQSQVIIRVQEPQVEYDNIEIPISVLIPELVGDMFATIDIGVGVLCREIP